MELSKFCTKEGVLDYTSLIPTLTNNSFEEIYPNYTVLQIGDNFIIKDGKYNVIIYNNPIEITIICKEEIKLIGKFHIQSNIDIENWCKNNSIDLKDLFFFRNLNNGNGNFISYEDNISYLLSFKREFKIQLFYHKKISFLKTKILLDNFSRQKDYKINEISSFYKYYFNDTDIESNFKYIGSKQRTTILNNLTFLFFIDNIKKYKITGPNSIGKSILLLYFCRTTRNCFYINLKIINTKSRIEAFSLLIEEFSNIEEAEYQKIKKLLEDKYYSNSSPMDAIFDLIKYFEVTKTLVMFVFDQHKMKYYPGTSYIQFT